MSLTLSYSWLGSRCCPVCIGSGFLAQMMWPWGIRYNLSMTTYAFRDAIGLDWGMQSTTPSPSWSVQPQCPVMGPSPSCLLLWNNSRRLYLVGSSHEHNSVRSGVWHWLKNSFGKKIEDFNGMRGMKFTETKMCINIYVGLLLDTLWPKYWFIYTYF